MELLCLVLAHVIIRAWEHGRAQAGAEWRRAREHMAGEFARRVAEGEASGPLDSWWWWVGAGHRAWRSMRGPRAGAGTATALPGSTPWRRIRQAARAGAARGAADGRRQAAERKAARRQARAAAGGSRTSWGAGRAAGAAGYAAGWARGHVPRPGRPNWHRPNWSGWSFADLRDLFGFVQQGVCDKCGAVCALSAMDYQHVDVGGRTETWLLCAHCRAEPDPKPAPAPVSAVASVEEYAAVTGGHLSDGPLSLQAAPDGTAPDAAQGPVGDSAPAVTDAEPITLDAPGPGAIEDAPGGELAAGDNSPTNATDITDGGQMTEITPGGNRPGTDVELAGNRLPASADAYNYGANARAEENEAQLLEDLGLYLDATLDDLNAVNASRRQVENVTKWVERIRFEAGMGREVTEAMDRRYKPLIAVVGAVGGPEEISDMAYYEEV